MPQTRMRGTSGKLRRRYAPVYRRGWRVVKRNVGHQQRSKLDGVGRVKIFALEITVRRRTGVRDGVAQRVVFEGVSHSAGGVRELPYRPKAVVAVEAGRPDVIDDLILADPLQAVGVGARHRAGRQLVKDLRIAGWVHV